MLVKTLKRVREAEGRLDVVVTSERVAKVFRITGLDALIPLHATVADALAELTVPAATLSIPPSVEHVRTARLVAPWPRPGAGLDEETVDDVRLAVGEAVARAVLRHGAAEIAAHVDVVVRDDGLDFEVEVRDRSDVRRPRRGRRRRPRPRRGARARAAHPRRGPHPRVADDLPRVR